MEDKLPYLFAAIITGSLIAGGTNVLAIFMLFRPHRPLYIRRFQLPFTPGLIPGKQKQLAEKIADIVAEHLLTPEAISKSLRRDQIEQRIKFKLLEYWQTHASSTVALGRYLDKAAINRPYIQAAAVDLIIQQCHKINQPELINSELEQAAKSIADRKINQLLSVTAMTAVDEIIKKLAASLLEHLRDRLQDKKTGVMLLQMLDETLAIKNTLMRKLFFNVLSDENVLEQISEKLQKLLTNDAVSFHLTAYLSKQWQNLHETDIKTLRDKYPEQSEYLIKQMAAFLYSTLQSGLNSDNFRTTITKEVDKIMEKVWNMPFASLLQILEPYKDSSIERISCTLTNTLQTNTEEIIRSINIREVVEQQVASFPSTQLEEIILKIAKKELQYITLVGALIGAVLGLVQFMLAYSSF